MSRIAGTTRRVGWLLVILEPLVVASTFEGPASIGITPDLNAHLAARPTLSLVAAMCG